jgi:hypothetical protein
VDFQIVFGEFIIFHFSLIRKYKVDNKTTATSQWFNSGFGKIANFVENSHLRFARNFIFNGKYPVTIT